MRICDFPCDTNLPAQPIRIRKAHPRKKSPQTFAHLVNFSENVSAMFDNHTILSFHMMFSLRDLRFVLCSRDLDVPRAQRIMGFILITHKSTKSNISITWFSMFLPATPGDLLRRSFHWLSEYPWSSARLHVPRQWSHFHHLSKSENRNFVKDCWDWWTFSPYSRSFWKEYFDSWQEFPRCCRVTSKVLSDSSGVCSRSRHD